jgi:hypothetical protein
LPGEGWLKGNLIVPFWNRELNTMDSRMNKGTGTCRGAFFNGAVESINRDVLSTECSGQRQDLQISVGKVHPFSGIFLFAWNAGIPTDASRMGEHVE